jgi:phage gpG-like protein
MRELVNDIKGLAADQIKRANDLHIPFKEIAGVMLMSFQENFDKQGRPDKWKPLKMATLRARWYRLNKGKGLILKRYRANPGEYEPQGGRSEMTLMNQSRGGKKGFKNFVANAKILQDTGWLMNSFISGKHPDHIQRIVNSNMTLELGSNTPYAAVHDMGSRDGKIPQREIAMIQEEDSNIIADIISGWIVAGREGMKNASI